LHKPNAASCQLDVVLRSLRVNRLATDSEKAFVLVACVLRFEKVVFHISQANRAATGGALFSQRLNLVGRQQRRAPGAGQVHGIGCIYLAFNSSLYIFDFVMGTNFLRARQRRYFLLARCTAHCLTQTTCSRIDCKVPAPYKLEGRDPDHQDYDSPLDHRNAEQGLWEGPSPLEEGSGMKPLWLTSIPSAIF